MSRRLMPQHGPDEDYPSRWMMPQHGSNGDNTSHRLMPQHGPDGVYLPRWSMPQHGPNGGSFHVLEQRLHGQGMFYWRSTHIGMPFVERAATMMKRQCNARRRRKHGVATIEVAVIYNLT